jgi:replication factor C subunit 1
MRALAKAAESISNGDVINSALRRGNNWSLGPAALTLMGIVPATYMRGPRELLGLPNGNEMNFPRFTAWLGNYSSSNKQRRLLGEVTTTMSSSGHMPSHR